MKENIVLNITLTSSLLILKYR